jgi:hypothetical protein
LNAANAGAKRSAPDHCGQGTSTSFFRPRYGIGFNRLTLANSQHHGPLAEHPLLRLPAVGDNVAMMDPSKRERRWFQFSLRTLMIVVTLLVIPCALLGRKIEPLWFREHLRIQLLEELHLGHSGLNLLLAIAKGNDLLVMLEAVLFLVVTEDHLLLNVLA